MKKITALLLGAIMLFSFTACFGGGDESMDEVLDKKAIIMGYDKNYMPMGFADENGTYTGFDIDLAKAICKRIITPSGVQATLNVMPVSGEDGVEGLVSGSIDFLGNSMSAHGEGEDSVSYSTPLFKNRQVIVVTASSKDNSKEHLEGKKIAVAANSVSAEALAGDSSFSSKVTVVDAADVKTAVAELEGGNADAVVMDEVCAKYLISRGSELRIFEEELKTDDYRLVFNKDSKALSKQINKILKELEEDGTLEELSVKWFGENIIDLG